MSILFVNLFVVRIWSYNSVEFWIFKQKLKYPSWIMKYSKIKVWLPPSYPFQKYVSWKLSHSFVSFEPAQSWDHFALVFLNLLLIKTNSTSNL